MGCNGSKYSTYWLCFLSILVNGNDGCVIEGIFSQRIQGTGSSASVIVMHGGPGGNHQFLLLSVEK